MVCCGAMRITFWATALLFVSGCGALILEGRVRNRASYDIRCSSEDITVSDIGGRAWRATGCGRSATYVCIDETCVLNGRDLGTYAPPSAPAAPPSPVESKAAKALHVTDHGTTYDLPAGFALDDDAKIEVYRDGGRHHAVRLNIEKTADTADAFLIAKHPSAKVWSTDNDGTATSYARWSGTTLRFASAAIARDGRVYELACSSDDVTSEKTDAVCTQILKSFRFAAGGLPGE